MRTRSKGKLIGPQAKTEVNHDGPAVAETEATAGPSSTVNGETGIFNELSTINSNIERAAQGVDKLRREIVHLQGENARSKRSLDFYEESEPTSAQANRRKKASSQAQINQLKRKILSLEQSREKDRKKIKALRKREMRSEVEDLEDLVHTGGSGDIKGAKKLLMSFVQLIEKPSLAEDEECDICMGRIDIKDARSLPCNHILCEGCMRQLDPPNCPHCRAPFKIDDTENITFTAEQQWDELLQVAAEAARFVGSENDSISSSGNDNELPFIDDGEESGSEDASEPETRANDVPLSPTSRLRKYRTSTPDAQPGSSGGGNDGLPSYSESPSSVKRKRMEALLASRQKKQRLL